MNIKTRQPYILYWICCFPCCRWYGPHDTCGIGRVQSTMLRFVDFCMGWYDILYLPRLTLIAKILLFKIVCIQHFSVFWNLWTKLYQTKSSLNAILWKGRACVLRHRGHNGQKYVSEINVWAWFSDFHLKWMDICKKNVLWESFTICLLISAVNSDLNLC